MNLELNAENQQTLDQAIQSGLFRNAADVVNHAFDIIRDELADEDWMKENHEVIAAQIAEGFAQSERGELIPADQVRQELDRRLAARK